MTKIEAEIKDFKKAINKLAEVLAMPKDEIVRDSAIQRFEFCMDLAWKTLKTTLEEKDSIIVHSPTNAFKEAYKQGYIEYDDKWIGFMKMRNETVHTYKEEVAEEIYQKLGGVLDNLKKLVQSLE